MQRLSTVQSSTSYGVIDPLAQERRDTKFLQSSLSEGTNIMLLPQGPTADRGGSTDFGKLRLPLEKLGALDAAEQTDNSSWPLYVTLTLSQVEDINAVDIEGFAITQGDGVAAVLTLQYESGASWIDFGSSEISPSIRNRRFAVLPDASSVTAQNWRIKISGPTDTRTVSAAQAIFHKTNNDDILAVSQTFNFEGDRVFQVVLTQGNADIFKSGIWQSSAAYPCLAGQLYRVKLEKKYDTILLFHPKVVTTELQRQGADDAWNSQPVEFENIPLRDFVGTNYTQPLIASAASHPSATGGTASNIIDGNDGTVSTPTIGVRTTDFDNQIWSSVDLGITKQIERVSAVDVNHSGSGNINSTLAYSTNGVDWTQYGDEFQITATSQTFEHQETINARYIGIRSEDRDYTTDGFDPFEIAELEAFSTFTGLNEIQEIKFPSIANNDIIEVYVNGDQAQNITYNGSSSTFAADLQATIIDLSFIDPGLVVTNISSTNYRIVFSGGSNAARAWSAVSLLNATKGFSAIVTRTQRGRAGGEPMVSEERGYAGVGKFSQERLLLAGFEASPNSLLGSVTGDPYNLDTERGTATAAFLYDIDGGLEETLKIVDMLIGSRLMMIGTNGVAYLQNETLSAEEVPKFLGSDAPGIKASTRPVQTDARIVYSQEGGTTINVMNYSELEQNFVSDNASLLSAFLINEPVSIAHRKPVDKLDSDLLFMVMADGSQTIYSIMRNQEISGYWKQTFDGNVKSVAIGSDRDVWLTVEHDNDGASEMRLEKQEFDKFLDSAIEQTHSPATALIENLERFNGKEIWVVGDRQTYGPFTVSGGNVTLTDAVSESRAGFWQPPVIKDHAIYLEEETRQQMARLKRVYELVLSVIDTNSIAISANGGELTDINLERLDQALLDEPALDKSFTGLVEVEGLPGFTREGIITVSQTRPGKLCLRSVKKHIVA